MSRAARALLAMTYLALLYTILYRVAPDSLRLPTGPHAALRLGLAVLAALLAEALRAVRLAMLYWGRVDAHTYGRALRARFIGNMAALLTPSVAGGEVARGLVLHGRLEVGAARAIAAAALDGGLDLVTNYLFALAALLASAAPAAPLPEALTAPIFAAWVTALTLVSLGMNEKLEALATRLERLSRKLAGAVREISEYRVEPHTLIGALLVSLTAWLLHVTSYWIYAGCPLSRALGCTVETILMGVIPAPGGIGPGEVLLANACSGIASWRLLYTLATVAPGAALIIA